MNDLIYNQRKIPRAQWRYGLRASAATGCGWIATYNALRLMGYRAEPEALIRFYERQLPLIHGNAGTSILAPALFFRKKGFRVATTSVWEALDERAMESDVCILFYYWRKKYRFGAHFVTVQYRDGQFYGYNTFRDSEGPDPCGRSLASFLKKHHYFGPVLIGIRHPDTPELKKQQALPCWKSRCYMRY